MCFPRVTDASLRVTGLTRVMVRVALHVLPSQQLLVTVYGTTRKTSALFVLPSV